jgi:hypothetical protein
MKKKNVYIFLVFFMLWMAFGASYAHTKSSALSFFANKGYVFLHPYFSEKSWEIAGENLLIDAPDIQPLSFDIGKNVDTTIAVFSTAQGDLFLMHSYFTPYLGGCQNGDIAYSAPQKIPLSGISLSANTPIYLIKDSPSFGDSIRVVVGTSSSFLYAVIVNVSTVSIVKIDTLQMQNAGAIVRILGDYSASAQRDTAIWAVGVSGTIRSFSVSPNALGQEKKWDIASLSDTIKCIGGNYAGTANGKIYRKNTSQTFVLENAGSGNAVNAIYPQGAIGAQGNFIEHVGTSWRSSPLGTSNYQYANFIRSSGGFGVELLDSKWNIESYTYRDSSSKILLTFPTDKKAYVNNGAWTYPLSNTDTGASIYILDPDSNYSDLSMSLKNRQTTIPITTSDGGNVLSPIPDTETCRIGIVKLSDGIINVKLLPSSIIIKANSEVGTQNIDCGTCYWKTKEFVVTKPWGFADTLIIQAGSDKLKIENTRPVITISSNSKMPETNTQNVRCKISGNQMVLNISFPNLKNISVFDISGRRILSIATFARSSIVLPYLCSHGIVFVELTFSNGTSSKMAIPVVH